MAGHRSRRSELHEMLKDVKVCSMSTPELRKRWRQFWNEWDKIVQENCRRREAHRRRLLRAYMLGVLFPPEPALEDLPLMPSELRDMACGATTRSGTPCKRRDLYRNGRCRLHGGLSTGPRTKRGKRKAS